MRAIFEHWIEVLVLLSVSAALVVGVVSLLSESTCYEWAHSSLRSIPSRANAEEYRATLYERCRIEKARERDAEESERQ